MRNRLVVFVTIFAIALTIIIISFNNPNSLFLKEMLFSSATVDSDIYRQETNDGARGMLYVENAKSDSVSVIDLATNEVVKDITVGNSPHDLKISINRFYTPRILILELSRSLMPLVTC